jgi:uridine kinase
MPAKSVHVITSDGTETDVKSGTRVDRLLTSASNGGGLPFVAAKVNNDVVGLSYPLTVGCRVDFLTIADAHGWRVYRKSLTFVMAKCVHHHMPAVRMQVEHSFGLGIFCRFVRVDGSEGITPDEVAELDQHMRALIELDVSIDRRKLGYDAALAELAATGRTDTYNLLRYRNPPHVIVHTCEDFSDLAHGPLARSAGVLTQFELISYEGGIVLHLPDRHAEGQMVPFEDQPHLFQILREHREWGRILGVSSVGRLNEIVSDGEVDDFIWTAEALHEKKLASIAHQISADGRDIKVILVAGPSSAGKTTFAKRLSTHLKVNGLHPVTLSTDDYFVGDDLNPIGPDGKPDYEHVEAVDVQLFNANLNSLIAGEPVSVPRFNFAAKRREYNGEPMRLNKGQVIIVEGIHGLNPRLTEQVEQAHKFKIYINALTQLRVDDNNRISTTDNRLMRRMVRDHNYRSHSALRTLQMWPMVRAGEKRWIFPYQKEADATFNSALDYELAVLKPFVDQLLMQVKPTDAEYAEARRLSEFLVAFVPIAPGVIPRTSILREYIGGSTLRY